MNDARERPFRGRASEELVPNLTFCTEIEKLGTQVDSLELKVAPIESLVIDGNLAFEIETKRIEKLLNCATAPSYDPHGPARAKEDFEIRLG
jgi:hypothetical protein